MYENKSIEETIKELGSDRREGLSEKEAASRYLQYGRNELLEKKKRTALQAFFAQLNDPLIYVLIGAAGVSLCMREGSDAAVILLVIVINALTGMIQEGKAQKALDSLKKLVSLRSTVIREGKVREIDAACLVPGDLVVLETGCQVPADLRLLESQSLQTIEASLTGESLPVQKDAHFRAEGDLPLGDRRNMVYMSTVVTGGRGTGVVTDTGMHTQIGKIAGMIAETKEEMTPLQKKLGELGKVLSVLSLLLCAALFATSLIQERNVFDMLLTAISLAVAAVPEGLPAVVTICLALSVTRMARMGTIVRKLPSVETLGAVSMVCTDKTGTLTCNRMSVVRCNGDGQLWETSSGANKETGEQQAILEAMVLCNDGVLKAGEEVGDPTELALLCYAADHKVTREGLEEKRYRCGEIPFDARRKCMYTFYREGDRRQVYLKGAPDVVLEKCSRILLYGKEVPLTEAHRRKISRSISSMTGDALRVLAFARKETEAGKPRDTEKEFCFLGMTGLQDPARKEAKEAVATFKKAGVETVMITGDHVETALAIGRQLGIARDRTECMTGAELSAVAREQLAEKLQKKRIFARVAPDQKVQIVEAFQKAGKIVAMTGDGVNDAPSLRKADIGIAMGRTGTDVAKQAADMILTDDNFATIEKAIEEGRGVYENIRKSVIFLLSSNLGEIITMFAAVLVRLAAPLTSLHILWINLITDSLPALALGVDKNDGKALMKRPPRDPEEGLFSGGRLGCTCYYGFLIAVISLTAFLLLPWQILHSTGSVISPEHIRSLLEKEEILKRSRTYAFTVLGMSQLFHAVGMRDTEKSFFRFHHLENKVMLLALALGFGLQFAVTEIPALIRIFGTVPLTAGEWGMLILLSAMPLLSHEALVLTAAIGDRGEKHPQENSVGRRQKNVV